MADLKSAEEREREEDLDSRVSKLHSANYDCRFNKHKSILQRTTVTSATVGSTSGPLGSMATEYKVR